MQERLSGTSKEPVQDPDFQKGSISASMEHPATTSPPVPADAEAPRAPFRTCSGQEMRNDTAGEQKVGRSCCYLLFKSAVGDYSPPPPRYRETSLDSVEVLIHISPTGTIEEEAPPGGGV